MRFGKILLLVPALLITLLTSCSRETPSLESNSPTDQGKGTQTERAANPHLPLTAQNSKRVVLAVKWPVGNRYVYRMDLTQRSTNTLERSSDPVYEEVSLGMTYALSVLKTIPAGGRDLEVEFLAYELQIKMGDQVVIGFDSVRSNHLGNPVPEPFRKLIGSKVRLQTDARGALDKIIDLDQWAKNLAGNSPGPAGEMLVQQFNEGFFQQLASFGNSLSAQPVEIGESWPYKTEVPAGAFGKISVNSMITFKRWEAHEQQQFAILETRGTLSGAPGARSNKSVTLDQGTTLGTAWLDPALGALMESAVEQTMRLIGPGPDPAPSDLNPAAASFRSEIGQKVTVKLVELSRVNL